MKYLNFALFVLFFLSFNQLNAQTVTGLNVNYVAYSGSESGTFEKTGDGKWTEYKSGSRTGHATFTEQGKTANVVNLTKHDGARIQLDIQNKRVNFKGSFLYNITTMRAESGSGNSGNNSNQSNTTTYKVGDFAQGGIVFYVDETGQHGLVMAKNDQHTGIRWHGGKYVETRAQASGPFSGERNTALIIAVQTAAVDDGNMYAAILCNELRVKEGDEYYYGWYLPSAFEFSLIMFKLDLINSVALSNGGTALVNDQRYWTSSEGISRTGDSKQDAVCRNGGQMGPIDKNTLCRVRAVRRF